MSLFAKKKEDDKKRFFDSIERDEIKAIIEPEHETQTLPAFSQTQEPHQQQFAPLFVKVERYYDILNSMHELKNTLDSLKSVLTNLNKIESMKEKNMQNLHDVVSNLGNTMESLDAQFLRPPNFHPESGQQFAATEQLDDVLHDLKMQVGKLKGELKEMT